MPDTKTMMLIRATLTSIENAQLSINTLDRQPEFKDSRTSRIDIVSLQNALHYSEKLLKQLVQRAAAHSLKKE